MNLLVITRKVDRNDALAGFAYAWVKRISLALPDAESKLRVICLEKLDTSNLPDTVEIYSLGKESGVNRWGRFIEFQKLAWRLVRKSDGIFCHMNPEYTINVWPYAKLFRKKIVSWYTHGRVTWKTKLLERLADRVLTASPESFRIQSKKVLVTGHGIDTSLFEPKWKDHNVQTPLTLLTIGRISPTKDLESLIQAVRILKKAGVENFKAKIIGEPGLQEHYHYYEILRQMSRKMGLDEIVQFLGPVPNKNVVQYLQGADIFINLSGTGSLDKAILEAMACGCIVITSNEAFRKILGSEFLVPKNDPHTLAQKILWAKNLGVQEKERVRRRLREEILEHHNLEKLSKIIVGQFMV